MGASNYDGLAFPKGPSRKRVKSAKQRHERAVRLGVKAAIWRRSLGMCECCGRTEEETGCWPPHAMHEWPPRSKTRGSSPEERFQTKTSLRLCALCHRRFHDYTLRAVPSTAAGFDALYEVQHRASPYRRYVGDWEGEWEHCLWVNRGRFQIGPSGPTGTAGVQGPGREQRTARKDTPAVSGVIGEEPCD